MVKQLQIEIDNISLKCGDIIYEKDIFYLKCLFCDKYNIPNLKQFTDHILTDHLKQSNDKLLATNESEDVQQTNLNESWKTAYLEEMENESTNSTYNYNDYDEEYCDSFSEKEEIEYLDNNEPQNICIDSDCDYNDAIKTKNQFDTKNKLEIENLSLSDEKHNIAKQLQPKIDVTHNRNLSEFEKEKMKSEDISSKYSVDDLLNLSSIKKGLFQCGLCPKIYNKCLYLTRHLKDHLNGPGECSICGKFYTFKRYLIKHYRYAHKESDLALRKKEKDIPQQTDQINNEEIQYKSKLNIEMNTNFVKLQVKKEECLEISEKEKYDNHNFINNPFYVTTRDDIMKEIEEYVEESSENQYFSKYKSSVLCNSTEDLDKLLNSAEDSLDDITIDEIDTAFYNENSTDSIEKDFIENTPKKKIKLNSRKSPTRRSTRSIKAKDNIRIKSEVLLNENKDYETINKNLLSETQSEKEYDDKDLEEKLKELNVNELLLLSTNENGRYYCVFCKCEFKNDRRSCELFKKHLNDHLISGNGFAELEKFDESDDNNIKKIIKDETESNECPLCTESFETEDAVEEHLATHLEKKQVKKSISPKKTNYNRNKKSNEKQCKICKRTFKYNHELKTHAEAHIPDKLKCDRCGKRYPNEWSLRDHIEWHTGYGYKCSECGVEFFEEHLYNRHLKEHFGINIYPCAYNCGRRFLSSTFKRKHERIVHLKLAIFQCELCGRKFMQAGQLNTHRATAHSDARPFKCDICNKTFKVYSRLTRHKIVVHSTELAYQCQICNALFKALSNLRQHEKIHLENKEYECDHCKCKFSQAAGLYSHLKVKHKVENPSARKRKPSDEYTVEYIDVDYDQDASFDETIDYAKDDDVNSIDKLSFVDIDIIDPNSEQYEIIYEDNVTS